MGSKLPPPTMVKWATRRRIWTIPDEWTPVPEILGPAPYPLGTIIRYRTTGSMFRWCGYFPDSPTGPWERIN